VQPWEVAEGLGLNPRSVRARLSELRRRGRVVRPFHGFYLIDEVDGGVLPRVQNLVVVGDVVCGCVVEHERVERVWGGLRVFVEFGVRFNRVSWVLACGGGVDLVGLRLCRAFVEALVECRGLVVGVWFVHNVEQLRDFMGVRLDGLSCLTLDALDSFLEKVYERDCGVRREVRSSRVRGLDELVGLLQGDVPEYMVVRGLHLLQEDVAGMRGGLDRVVDHVVALNRIVKAQRRSRRYDKDRGCYVYDINFKTQAPLTERTIEVAEAFGIGVDEEHTHILYSDFELKLAQGDIVYITGDRGSGKSVLLKALKEDLGDEAAYMEELDTPTDASIIDTVGTSFTEGLRLLSMVGLNDAYLFLRRTAATRIKIFLTETNIASPTNNHLIKVIRPQQVQVIRPIMKRRTPTTTTNHLIYMHRLRGPENPTTPPAPDNHVIHLTLRQPRPTYDLPGTPGHTITQKRQDTGTRRHLFSRKPQK